MSSLTAVAIERLRAGALAEFGGHMAVERVAGQQAFRVALESDQPASAAQVNSLISQARSLAKGSLSGFEFRLKQSAGGDRFLELRKQTGWGAFKEALKIGQHDRAAERSAALAALPAAFAKLSTAQQLANRSEARSLVGAAVQLSPTAVRIEADSARIAEDPIGAMLSAWSAGDRFDKFEFAESTQRAVELHGSLWNEASGVTRSEYVGQAIAGSVAPKIQDMDDEALNGMYSTFLKNPRVMLGMEWVGACTTLAMKNDSENVHSTHPLINVKNLSPQQIDAQGAMYSGLANQIASAATAVHETLVNVMMDRGLLTREGIADTYSFQGQQIDYNKFPPSPDNFAERLAERAYWKVDMLEAILEMKREALQTEPQLSAARDSESHDDILRA